MEEVSDSTLSPTTNRSPTEQSPMMIRLNSTDASSPPPPKISINQPVVICEDENDDDEGIMQMVLCIWVGFEPSGN